MGWKWLHIPWLPLEVLGTAVSLIVSFKNNASYNRLWEALKIWRGVVNTSLSFTVMIKDFIKSDGNISDSELKAIHKELVYRNIAWMTALRCQLRKDKPWENHLKNDKSNQEFRLQNIYIIQDNVSVKDVISNYIASSEVDEIYAKGNQAS